MNIFAQASKQKLRFNSPRGLLTVEDLWNLPLQAPNKLDLESLVNALDTEIGDTPKRSRITKKKTVNATLTLQLDIVEYIIEYKLQLQEEASIALGTKARKELLLQALVNKEADDLKNLSTADIKKQLKIL